MTGLSPQLVTLLASSSGIALMMVLAAVGKHQLEWRRHRRSCPSCGRHIDGRTCGCVN